MLLVKLGLHFAWVHREIVPIINPSSLSVEDLIRNAPARDAMMIRRTSAHNMTDSFAMVDRTTHAKTEHQILVEQRQRQRRERTKVLANVNYDLLKESPALTSPSAVTKVPVSAPYDWQVFCNQAQLSAKSVVLITGFLSQPPAIPLALLLNKQCGVVLISGADMMFPNLRIERMKRMKMYHDVKQRIPSLNLIVPHLGLLYKEDWTEKWITTLQPTHVFHLETQAPHWDSSTMSLDAYNMYRMQSSLQSMSQLSLAISHMPQDRQPSFIHIKSTMDKMEVFGRVLSSNVTHNLNDITASTFQVFKNVSMVRLLLPPVFGPLVTNYPQETFATLQDVLNQTAKLDKAIYVDDALATILQAMATCPRCSKTLAVDDKLLWSSKQLSPLLQDAVLRSTDSTQVDQRLKQSITWVMDQLDPYNKTLPYPQMVQTNYMDTYSMHRRPLPCASQCASRITKCEPSAFDSIIQISHNATKNCKNLVYLAAFDKEISQLYKPASTGNELCRVAYVSGRSLLMTRVKKQVASTSAPAASQIVDLSMWNGKVTIDGWRIVWLPDHDAETMSDADYSLPIIDPSRLFHSSVHKAMYADSNDFAEPADDSLLAILMQIDRRELGEWQRKDIRPGTEIRRFIKMPPTPARNVVLFAGEPMSLPKNAQEYARSLEALGLQLPKAQISFYQQMGHSVQTNWLRPEGEIRGTVYKEFPYQWLSMSVIVHDMRLARAQTLRCEWLDEYLFWGSNRDAEPLSLAYVLGQQRILGIQEPPAPDDEGWYPIMASPDERLLDDHNGEVFLRVMTRNQVSKGS
jgi:hypothetical protein